MCTVERENGGCSCSLSSIYSIILCLSSIYHTPFATSLSSTFQITQYFPFSMRYRYHNLASKYSPSLSFQVPGNFFLSPFLLCQETVLRGYFTSVFACCLELSLTVKGFITRNPSLSSFLLPLLPFFFF